jgi:uncharacterized repeat protein (TIGR03803 family)
LSDALRPDTKLQQDYCFDSLLVPYDPAQESIRDEKMKHNREAPFGVVTAFCVLAGGALTACGGDGNHSTAPQTQVLLSFGHETPVVVSPSGLVLGKDGNLYGTALGGDYDRGVIFKLTRTGVESVVHSFNPATGDGGEPSGLILGSDGNFYGTTIAGGTNDAGTVFELTSDGTESVVYSFKGPPSDSAYAASGLFQASNGNFYGTSDFGGPENKGTVFEVSPSGIETVLYSFGSVANDPAGDYSSLVESDDGNFYGVSDVGGMSSKGAVFKITPEGILTLAHSFTGGSNDGIDHYRRALLKGKDGNFYGVAGNGGPKNGGIVYKLTPAGEETIVYAFESDSKVGSGPEGTLVEDVDGNLYGAAQYGGSSRTTPANPNADPSGSIFEISAAGNAVLLSNFGPTNADGTHPSGPLVLGQDGTLYGVTSSGGTNDSGVFYEITR